MSEIAEFENVEILLTEFDQEEYDEQRDSERYPLVRPVRVLLGDDTIVQGAFSRDISAKGIGTISSTEFPEGCVGYVAVHSLQQNDVVLKAIAKWSAPYGYGWFATGWEILSDVKESS